MPSGLKILLTLLTLGVGACEQAPWNNPYPASESGEPVYYDMFSERPKHLDPVSAYSADEYKFIGQIYEPPLQYHFLKRPYELTTLTAESVPEPMLFDADDERLPADAPVDAVDYSVYRISIKPGIEYQPHPAFARDADGNYRYHALEKSELEGIRELSDFEHHGTRELTAADYVYQIKRTSAALPSPA